MSTALILAPLTLNDLGLKVAKTIKTALIDNLTAFGGL